MTEDTSTVGKMEKTLAERGGRYGSWRLQSAVTQQIKRAFAATPNWEQLPDYLRETLDQAANKIARILSGDFMYNDNLHDLVGYFRLAEECLNQDIADGVEGPHIVDPNNPPVEWLLTKLTDMGFELGIASDNEVITVDGSKVRDPAYLKDAIRATGMRFSSPPPAKDD